MTRAGGVDYVYDANGAMVSATFTGGGGSLRGFTWSSFNKPVRVEGAGGILASEFVYGPSRARIRQTVFSGALETGAITYIGGAFERHTATGAPDELVHYIAAGGVVAIFTKVDDGAPATDRLRYPHKDHLGSVDMVTDETGAVAESRSFGPWGRARNTDWSAAGTDIPLTETKRGFTGHEHLDNVGLIHMNGRIYDPVIGRMVSADPFIQAPGNAQSYNRYSYVQNNPLSFTDPSGFGIVSAFGNFFTSIYKDLERLGNWFMGNALAQAVVQIAAIAACGGTPVCAIFISGAFSGAQTAVAGGNLHDILTSATMSAMFAGVSVGMSTAIGNSFGNASGFVNKGMKTVAHGISGGMQSVMRRGSFRSGFLAGGFAEATSGFVQNNFTTPEGRITAAAVAGGGGSALGGGKFSNGAITGAFQRLFNDEMDHKRKITNEEIKELGVLARDFVREIAKMTDAEFRAKFEVPDHVLDLELGIYQLNMVQTLYPLRLAAAQVMAGEAVDSFGLSVLLGPLGSTSARLGAVLDVYEISSTFTSMFEWADAESGYDIGCDYRATCLLITPQGYYPYPNQ